MIILSLNCKQVTPSVWFCNVISRWPTEFHTLIVLSSPALTILQLSACRHLKDTIHQEINSKEWRIRATTKKGRNLMTPVWPSDFIQSSVLKHVPELRSQNLMVRSSDPLMIFLESKVRQVTASSCPCRLRIHVPELKCHTWKDAARHWMGNNRLRTDVRNSATSP